MTRRREFLCTSALYGASLALPSVGQSVPLGQRVFTTLLDQPFRLNEPAVTLHLRQVQDYSRPDQPLERFTLHFEGEPTHTLEKAVYPLYNPHIGRLWLFLEPDDIAHYYAADFALLR